MFRSATFAPALRASYSALSKRTTKVKVQLLKDFPKFQLYKGQVTLVRPSLMRNFLHLGNGARYVLQDQDIDQILLAQSKRRDVRKDASSKRKVERVKKTKSEELPVGQEEQKEDKGVFSSGVTVEDVNIPGLNL